MSRAPPPGSAEQLVVVRLWAAQQALERRLVEELAEAGISLAEFRLVGELLREPSGLRQGELARRLGVRPPTVSTAVARLVEAGVLEQSTEASDHRGRRVRVVSRATARAGVQALEAVERSALRGLSASQRRELGRLLDVVLKGLEEGEP